MTGDRVQEGKEKIMMNQQTGIQFCILNYTYAFKHYICMNGNFVIKKCILFMITSFPSHLVGMIHNHQWMGHCWIIHKDNNNLINGLDKNIFFSRKAYIPLISLCRVRSLIARTLCFPRRLKSMFASNGSAISCFTCKLSKILERFMVGLSVLNDIFSSEKLEKIGGDGLFLLILFFT